MSSTASHLAFITPRFSAAATIGGAETLLKQLALRARRAGRRVTLLTTCADDHFTWQNHWSAGRSDEAGLTVIRFPVDENRDLGTFFRVQDAISAGRPVTPADEAAWMRNNVNSTELYQHLREAGTTYDHIIAGPYLFSLIYEAALIHPERTWLVPCLHDEPFARLAVMQNLFNRVHGLLFNTEPERDLARELFALSDKPSAVVGMGLEAFDVDPAAFATRHGFNHDYIIYSGRREPLKGTPLLLDYLAAFRKRSGRDIRLVLTGSGPIEPPTALAPYVLDMGFVSEQEKHEAMAGALAFVHPSLNESLGIVLLEAWLAHTPALVHAHSRVLRWQCATSGGGLWFRHYPDFEEALTRLITQPDLRNQLATSGRAYVAQQYDWSVIERRFLEALDRM